MCRFVSPMQHALFLFPVIPTLHHTVNQHQYKYYYQRLAEAMEKMGSSTSFREIYSCLKWTTEMIWVLVRLYCQKKTFRFWQVMLSSKKSSTLRISMCWIWNVFKVLNTFSMHSIGMYTNQFTYFIQARFLKIFENIFNMQKHFTFEDYFARVHARFFVVLTLFPKIIIHFWYS